MDGVRIVEIDGLTGEVRAIVKEDIEMTPVGARVESPDELVVLRSGGFNTKGVAGSVVCGAHQLNPLIGRRTAVLLIGCDLSKVAAPILVAQVCNVFLTHAGGNLVRPIH